MVAHGGCGIESRGCSLKECGGTSLVRTGPPVLNLSASPNPFFINTPQSVGNIGRGRKSAPRIVEPLRFDGRGLSLIDRASTPCTSGETTVCSCETQTPRESLQFLFSVLHGEEKTVVKWKVHPSQPPS